MIGNVTCELTCASPWRDLPVSGGVKYSESTPLTNVLIFHKSLALCRKFCLSYLGTAMAARGAVLFVLPVPVCAVFSCLQTMVWLPVCVIFNFCKDDDACDRILRLCEHHKSQLWEKIYALVTMGNQTRISTAPGFWSDAVPAELSCTFLLM